MWKEVFLSIATWFSEYKNKKKSPAIHHLEPAWSWSVGKQECSPRLVNCNQFHIVFRHQSLHITAVWFVTPFTRPQEIQPCDFRYYLLSQTILLHSTFGLIPKATQGHHFTITAPPSSPFCIVVTTLHVPPFKGRNQQHWHSFCYF